MYIEFKGLKFENKAEFATYLSSSYKLLLKEEDSILQVLKQYDNETYRSYISITKNYQFMENKLTLLIYLLDPRQNIRLFDNVFGKVTDIVSLMRIDYPKKIEIVDNMLKDSLLADIFKMKYEETKQDFYLKYYDFFKELYEYREHDFIYYYFFYFHLNVNEKVMFIFNGVKMTSVEDLILYLKDNQKDMLTLVDKIEANKFILAILAVKFGLKEVVLAKISSNPYEMLSFMRIGNLNFDDYLKSSFAYYLATNYTKYEFSTKEAKALKEEYQNLALEMARQTSLDLGNFIERANYLYAKFIDLYEFNDLIEFRTGIKALKDEDKLKYYVNGYYVSPNYLKDNMLFDVLVYTKEKELASSKLVLIQNVTDYINQNEELKNEYYQSNPNIRITPNVLSLFVSILGLILSGLLCFMGKDDIISFDFSNLTPYFYILGAVLVFIFNLILFFVSIKKISNIHRFRNYANMVDKANRKMVDINLRINNLDIDDNLKKDYQKIPAMYQGNAKMLTKLVKDSAYNIPSILSILVNLLVCGLITLIFIEGNMFHDFIFSMITPLGYELGFINILIYGYLGLCFVLSILFRKHKIIYFLPYLVIIYLVLSYFLGGVL